MHHNKRVTVIKALISAVSVKLLIQTEFRICAAGLAYNELIKSSRQIIRRNIVEKKIKDS